MGVIDRAKSARKHLLDRLTPQRVVFHHVPKCGGTSVGRALRKRYLMSQATVTPESSFRAFEAFTGRVDREQMLIDVLDFREQMMLYLMYEDVRCISLHVRYSQVAYKHFSDLYSFITVLRDPIERFISHYNWSRDRSGAHASIEQNLTDFLKTRRAIRMGSTYAEYFSGMPKDSDFTSGLAIQLAIQNLEKFDVIGSTENMGRFSDLLREKLGVKLQIGYENIGREKDAVDELVLERITALCAPDIEIWNFVQNNSMVGRSLE